EAMNEHTTPIAYDLTSYKEETKNWDKDPSAYLLRYYTKHYLLATTGKDQGQPQHSARTTRIPGGTIGCPTGLQTLCGDQFVYQSPNKLCVTGLAPTHPLLGQRDRYQVLNIRFEPKILDSLPQPTAIPANSKKQPPPTCQSNTVICRIEARDLWCVKKQEEKQEKKESTITGDVHQDILAQTELNSLPSGSDFCSTNIDKTSSSSTPLTPSSLSTAPSGPDPASTATSGTTQRQEIGKPHGSVDSSSVVFVIRAAVIGHVIELNERLLRRGSTEVTDLGIIQTLLDKAATHGFIAVIRPKVDKTEIALKDLCTMEDYE
ncbi:hypothetical protein BGZ65_011276, partial [Modicella reniformis]